MRKFLIPAVLAGLVAASLPGCGGESDEIPVSEDAPKQADFDAMRAMMDSKAKVKTKKAD
ncbi:hypothetical protein [Paludisphaera sp.]|uniref:hypothetical protein n=1 Tax=Paludisphaera sp. TaxID=2017432 RepID=UPI00301D960C